MSTATETEVHQTVKPKLNVQKPPLYSVIYMNDEVTTMEFVVSSLMTVFNHSEEAAYDLCMKVHEVGSACVAVLPYELAEQKGVEATVLARNNGFPLMIRLEVA